MAKILITTLPFGQINKLPLDLLKKAGVEYFINPYKNKLTENQLAELVGDFDVLIAGTEPITEKVLSKAPKLKLISRVGIGLDSIDLAAAKKRGIKISYTPDAPSPAVAELTLGMTVADWWKVSDRPPNAYFIGDLNADGFFSLLTERLARL